MSNNLFKSRKDAFSLKNIYLIMFILQIEQTSEKLLFL